MHLQGDEKDCKHALDGNKGGNSVGHNECTVTTSNQTKKPE